MYNAGYATLQIMPSLKGFQGALQGQAKAPMKQAGERSGKAFGGGMIAASKSFAGPLAAVFAASSGVNFFKGAIAESSDLNESLNALAVTYGDAADGVAQLGREAASSLGLSNVDFNALAVQFGAFTKTIAGDGGDVTATLDELTTRAADFASVMNLEVADAARIFQSGLAGESEPLRKFGIDMSAASVSAFAYAEGIASTGETLTEAQKVQARYGLLMQQTAQAQGDFANTSDQLANRQRILGASFENLKAKLGERLLPALTAVVGFAVDKLLPGLEKLGPVAKGVGEAFGPLASQLGESIGPVLGQLGTFLTETLVPNLVAFGQTVSDTLGPVLNDVGTFIRDTVVPALSSLAGVLNDTIVPVAQDFARTVGEAIWPALQELWSGIQRDLLPALQDLWDNFSRLMVQLAPVGKAIMIVVGVVGFLVLQLIKVGVIILGKVLPPLIQLGTAMVKNLVNAISVAVGVIGTLVGAFVWVGETIGTAASKIVDFYNAIKEWVGKARDFVAELPGKIKEVLLGAKDQLVSAGRDLMSGFLRGLKQRAQAVLDYTKSFVDRIPSAVRTRLGIRSPSRVFMEIGRYTAEGLAVGLGQGEAQVQSAADRLLNIGSVDAATPDLPDGGLVGQLSELRIAIDVDASELDRVFSTRIERADQEQARVYRQGRR